MEARLCWLLLLAVISLIGCVDSQPKLPDANEKKVCPRKEHLIGSRKCKRACKDDSDCKGAKKRCVCDDICGLTCLNPNGRCLQPTVVNGRVDILGRKNQLGAVAKYVCQKGYELQGTETRICNGDREWSGVAPVCVPASKATADIRYSGRAKEPQNMDSGTATRALCSEPPSVMFADHDAPKQSQFEPGSEVMYHCRRGYFSDGIDKAKCMTNGKWAGPMMTCTEVSCPDLGDLMNGVLYGMPPYVAKSRINFECKKGYRLVGSPALTCQEDGKWDNDKPECQRESLTHCPKLKTPRHGIKISRYNTVGSSATILCDNGYRIVGTSRLTCLENATWSSAEPDCEPLDCGDPGHLYNGYIEGKQFTYGSVIKFRCMDGAKFDGLAYSATCLETGQWAFPLPRCLRSCERPTIESAQLVVGSQEAPALLDHGTELTILCQTGLAPNDPVKPICNNGTWSSLPRCVQGGCEQRPKEISNGMALYRGMRYGDRVRYICNTGYKLIGDKYLVCEGGQWQGSPPECKPIYCPHPGDLENGKILLVGDIGKFEYRPYVRQAGQGEKIEFYCSLGYRLEGPSAATCIDGYWSPDRRPKCVDNQHPV